MDPRPIAESQARSINDVVGGEGVAPRPAKRRPGSRGRRPPCQPLAATGPAAADDREESRQAQACQDDGRRRPRRDFRRIPISGNECRNERGHVRHPDHQHPDRHARSSTHQSSARAAARCKARPVEASRPDARQTLKVTHPPRFRPPSSRVEFVSVNYCQPICPQFRPPPRSSASSSSTSTTRPPAAGSLAAGIRRSGASGRGPVGNAGDIGTAARTAAGRRQDAIAGTMPANREEWHGCHGRGEESLAGTEDVNSLT